MWESDAPRTGAEDKERGDDRGECEFPGRGELVGDGGAEVGGEVEDDVEERGR